MKNDDINMMSKYNDVMGQLKTINDLEIRRRCLCFDSVFQRLCVLVYCQKMEKKGSKKVSRYKDLTSLLFFRKRSVRMK